MRAGLDDEGVTFSFDVPALLLAECRRRGQTVPELPDYLDTALLRTDPWGTKMRGYERFSQGDAAGAFDLLADASTLSAQYAGYEVAALLWTGASGSAS